MEKKIENNRKIIVSGFFGDSQLHHAWRMCLAYPVQFSVGSFSCTRKEKMWAVAGAMVSPRCRSVGFKESTFCCIRRVIIQASWTLALYWLFCYNSWHLCLQMYVSHQNMSEIRYSNSICWLSYSSIKLDLYYSYFNFFVSIIFTNSRKPTWW